MADFLSLWQSTTSRLLDLGAGVLIDFYRSSGSFTLTDVKFPFK